MRIKELHYNRRRSGSDVTISFDDGSTMALDADLAVRFHLSRGLDVSCDLRDEMARADELLKARRKLIQYLALRKKSTREAQRYLSRAGFSADASELAIKAATDLGYLDDQDFAESFARTRYKSGTKGPRAVKAELQARGISRDEALRVTATMTEPETQLEQARKLAAKKYPSLKDENDQVKAARRMSQHLARRGFDPDICDLITREFFGDPTIF